MTLPVYSKPHLHPLTHKGHHKSASVPQRVSALFTSGTHAKSLTHPSARNYASLPRSKRKKSLLLILLASLATGLTVLILRSSGLRGDLGGGMVDWTGREPSTLVFKRADLKRIWEWEISMGHFGWRGSVPKQIGFTTRPLNPALPPPQHVLPPSRYRPAADHVEVGKVDMDTVGVGHGRVYADLSDGREPGRGGYPPRPIQGGMLDIDVIMRYCDFSSGKYVRDCLEVLRTTGGLDVDERVRRVGADWRYVYVLNDSSALPSTQEEEEEVPVPVFRPPVKWYRGGSTEEEEEGLPKKAGAILEDSLELPAKSDNTNGDCEHSERVFHMFWTGPFTDKPYLALLSFLYTQNVGITSPSSPPNCPPVFWLWINPGPAASVPNPTAHQDMITSLRENPWSRPFLHPRFKGVVEFKMWNTTEMLDGVKEMEGWRGLEMFNSGGWVVSVKKDANATEGDDMENRAGSKSSSSYDRLSVILSDMARFVLTHRFGGIYLDADTILLRDWEELFNQPTAFAYRWSRLEKYNTAVLKLHKGSALGSFLVRTAVKNGMDFHPMSVSRYCVDAALEGLLVRMPDALFDSAWLGTEYYQRDRAPEPPFTEFSDFFDTPAPLSAHLTLTHFFRGAYSYHFHNFWWKPFDKGRDWPDLGARFESPSNRHTPSEYEEDMRDLDWSAVLKRTFEAFVRGEAPNMYGEWIVWDDI